MTPAVSVVIPTYNGARRLPAVLQALAAQDIPGGGFEVIVADNNSADDTVKVAAGDPAVAALHARGIECRCVREARQGVTFARIAGALAARAPLICFLDDDNLPAAANYLATGVAALGDPTVGLVIPKVSPRWEHAPPPSVLRRSAFLAINGDKAGLGYIGESPIDFGADGSMAPSLGAGMWVRREAFLSVLPGRHPELLLPGRLPGTMYGAGEDLEVGTLIGRAGWRRLYVPKLRLVHVIPRSRIETFAFSRLIVGNTRTGFTLESRLQIRGYGLARRVRGALRLAGALLAAPAVAVMRRDGVREALFIIAYRWAEFRGPFPEHAHPVPLTFSQRQAEEPISDSAAREAR